MGKREKGTKRDPEVDHFPWIGLPARSLGKTPRDCWFTQPLQRTALAMAIFQKTNSWTSRGNFIFEYKGIYAARVSQAKVVSLRTTNYVLNTNKG